MVVGRSFCSGRLLAFSTRLTSTPIRCSFLLPLRLSSLPSSSVLPRMSLGHSPLSAKLSIKTRASSRTSRNPFRASCLFAPLFPPPASSPSVAGPSRLQGRPISIDSSRCKYTFFVSTHPSCRRVLLSLQKETGGLIEEFGTTFFLLPPRLQLYRNGLGLGNCQRCLELGAR